ncbi:ATP-binding cassette domain-containing protein [Corynebacterium tuberculostearicum]|uniref:ATP-binding cassette domain-containing protein n=1 Tax=Corynebacterium tuberculostearicum TaxID=38304 RepID=A0AAE4NIB7_9CORY|nr:MULTISPECIES: ATP-binding cassette domain-containing protein [Corynebacterium]MCT1427016.1 ATP-binding cassette domain-containing protein [Corynebacterium sp. p3-SID1241]MDV2418228.1 ATP-binding cassette domain-containing protein [Corynebacterium tuberculostearicum]
MLTIDADYGHSAALGHLNRSFDVGRVYGLKGPNGAGKSTLLQTLGGELSPLEGTVSIDGAAPGSAAAAGSVVSVGDPVFLPDLTVGEHFRVLSRRSGVNFAEVHELWGIDDAIRNSAVSSLSSGQRQRVYLAAQLYQPAKALLIDEPERHLDHTWTAFLAEELRHLAANGRCVVLASHSPAIFDACDEVVDIS